MPSRPSPTKFEHMLVKKAPDLFACRVREFVTCQNPSYRRVSISQESLYDGTINAQFADSFCNRIYLSIDEQDHVAITLAHHDGSSVKFGFSSDFQLQEINCVKFDGVDFVIKVMKDFEWFFQHYDYYSSQMLPLFKAILNSVIGEISYIFLDPAMYEIILDALI